MSDGNAGTITTGAWLRLVRVGNSIQPQTSANGTKWANAGGKINITFNSSVNTGLIVTSKSTSTLATAKFDNVSLILG
jgi:hypothetical protein